MYRSLLLLLLIFCISCNKCNNTSEHRTVNSTDSVSPDKQEPTQLKDLPWVTVIDSKTGSTHLQHLPGNPPTFTPQQIIQIANKKYPQIQLEWIKKDGNTAYLKIADATYLTQSMGTAGAEAYLSEITYSFTELEGINKINLDFTEGDHASPGVYSRDQFKNLEN